MKSCNLSHAARERLRSGVLTIQLSVRLGGTSQNYREADRRSKTTRHDRKWPTRRPKPSSEDKIRSLSPRLRLIKSIEPGKVMNRNGDDHPADAGAVTSSQLNSSPTIVCILFLAEHPTGTYSVLAIDGRPTSDRSRDSHDPVHVRRRNAREGKDQNTMNYALRRRAVSEPDTAARRHLLRRRL